MGGLGNYLFQISSSYSHSIKNNNTYICDVSDVMSPHKPYQFYVKNILRKINFKILEPNYSLYYEPSFNYSEIPNFNSDTKLIGYFQSEKYFINYRKEILELFEIDSFTLSFLEKKYTNLLNQDICSIHVRRGDYVHLQNHHPTLSIDYYIESIKIIGESKHFLIFSDDIEWCKNNFDFIPNKTFVTENLDYQDLYLMSMCKNNIIANSSFSWWGAWLNNFESKKVIVPKKWFGVTYSNLDTKDLYPENWIKI